MPGQRRTSGGWLALLPLWQLACGASAQTHVPPDGGSPSSDASGAFDAGSLPVDAMSGAGCMLPAAPADVCAAFPTGKVIPCSQDGGQPSQTGYLEIDTPGGAPMYVCATSWSSNPDIGYIFGQPATFLSDAQGCCGGTVTAATNPAVPELAIGSLGTPRIPSHIKPQELQDSVSGPIRQNPFAVVVTDAASGAAATAAIATWLPWAGDGKPHAAPDGTGAYYFASGFPVNYVVLETSGGVPSIVIGPEFELTADGKTPVGHPSLGVCPAGGGAPLVLNGGELHGTTINNHSGRLNYGPAATQQALDAAAKLFNCLGISVTSTQYDAPKT